MTLRFWFFYSGFSYDICVEYCAMMFKCENQNTLAYIIGKKAFFQENEYFPENITKLCLRVGLSR